MADDPFSIFDGGAAPAVAAPVAAPIQTGQSDPFAMFDGGVAVPRAATTEGPAPPSAPPQPPAPDPGLIKMPGNLPSFQAGLTPKESSDLGAGVVRGIHDVIDKPAELLARGSDALGLTQGAAPGVVAADAAGRQDYDARPPDSGLSTVGRYGTQLAATLPIGGAAGGLAKGAGELLSAGAGEVAPALGKAADMATRFVGGAAGGPGSRLAQGASVAANSAIQGGAAAALTSGQSDEPVADQVLRGAEIGGALGPVARTLGAGAAAAKDALSGGEINPEVQRLAQLARDKYGINLTGDQISPSPFVQNLGAALRQTPGSGMAPAQAALQGKFTKAIATTIGEDTDQITPAVMERAASRIGGVMDDVASKTPAIPAGNLVNGLAQIENDASFLTKEQQGVIKKHIDNVMDAIGPDGTITGQQYQSLTKFNSPLGKALRSSDSDVRNGVIDIRSQLDNALGESLPPDSPLASQLQQARLQYKNLKTIEPLVTKGEPGEISPVALQGAVNRSFKGRGMREAQPDLGELADIGRQFNLRPDSGTAGRSAVNVGLGSIGTGIMGAAVTGNPLLAAAPIGAMAATAAAGRVAGNALRSPVYINRLLDSGSATKAPPSVLNSLLPSHAAAPTAAIVGNQLLSGPRRPTPN